MPLASYAGRLLDIGLGALPAGQRLILRIRPEEEAFSAEGLVSAAPKTLNYDATTGGFTFSALPSGELTSASTGRSGVDYIIEVGRFEDALDGSRFTSADVYRFTAAAGGGDIGGMKGGSLLAVWVGPPWPPLPSPRGLYIELTPPNEWGVRS
ncbi:hypothetical protein B0I12_002207 [Microbacterium hydrothermale]|uniref:hypothetical protein n=1 Tax=Microbacterium hydrothermale TaxID=857427 RepID=UPI0022260F28|nr:hypothetical protein [Microbacterium hydrothermale]MCW2165052.1 hypothetical protein [Microbacterium hydrothermale]